MSKTRLRNAILENDTALIPIGVNAKHGYAVVDIEDAWIAKYPWCLSHGYAMTKAVGKSVFMHRFVTNAKNGVIDHIDRNSLNNRKANLRLVTQKENTLNTSLRKDNTSGHRGIVWDKNRKRWLVRVEDNRYIGRFVEYADAVKARLDAEIKSYGYKVSA